MKKKSDTRILVKKTIYIVLSIFLTGIIFFSRLSSAQTQDWQLKKSKHFIVYYKQAPVSYINSLVSKAEYYYENITYSLGYKGFDFWTWENRCRIYLYPNRRAYLDITGANEWSRAHVNIKEKEINTYIGQDAFFDIILPHEMAHIIFREFVGFDKKLPLCLDEGLACFQEVDNFTRRKIAQEIVERDLYIPLEEIFKVGKFDFQRVRPVIFYSQCFSIMDFLLKRYGRNRFTSFCRQIRDGKSWRGALAESYQLNDLMELENQWINFLGEDLGS